MGNPSSDEHDYGSEARVFTLLQEHATRRRLLLRLTPLEHGHGRGIRAEHGAVDFILLALSKFSFALLQCDTVIHLVPYSVFDNVVNR
jgi:hypothetical protein